MSHSPSIWRQGPLYRGTAACEETEHGPVLTNKHSLNRPPARSPGRTAGKCAFVDLTRTSLFFHPTERIKGDNGRHQDPPLAPSRPTARTRYREASCPSRGIRASHSALRPPQPPCNLTGTTGYDKPASLSRPASTPSLLPKGEISAFLNSGQITTGGLVSQIRQQQISSQRVEPRRVFFFSRPPVVLHSGGHVVCTCVPSQVCAYRGAHRPVPLIMAFTWILSFPRITWRQLAAGLLSPSLLLETLIMQSSSTSPAIPEPRRVES